MYNVIDELQSLCVRLGLVINETKTKYQSRAVNGKEFWMNGIRLEKVTSYKYLGMYVSFCNNVKDQIAHVKNICTARLKPLKVLSNRGNGVGVPVLRSIYLSTVRSIIDYSAPVLASYSEKNLRPLEVIQNEGMRIVLGCPRTTRIEIMRLELNIPSVFNRIWELTAISALRLIRRGDDQLKSAVDNYRTSGNRNFKMNAYTKRICNKFLEYNVIDFCLPVTQSDPLEPWLMSNVCVRIDKLDVKKKDCYPYELRQIFCEKISKYPMENVIHMYCDGSVSGNKAGCGVIIREFFEFGISVEERLCKRISDRSSCITAELYAIYMGLNYAVEKKKTIFGFVDCQSALFALNTKTPAADDLVQKCRKCIYDIKSLGCDVSFMWIPSHCDIYFNEIADDLAKQGCEKDTIECDCSLSIKQIKSEVVKVRKQWEWDNARMILRNGSKSMKHYDIVMNNTNFSYGKAAAKYDVFMMRLRFGYKYFWEYGEGTDGIPCKLCGAISSHTLYHYIMECNGLDEYRCDGITNLTEMVCYMINNNVVKKIMNKFTKFDIRF